MAFGPRSYKTALRIPVFDGGLNTKYTDVSMPLNQSPDLKNVVFDDYGAVSTTQGYEKVTSIASAPIDGLHSYYNQAGERRLLAVCNGTVHYEDNNAFVPVSGSTGVYTSGVDVKIETVKDEAYFSNGYATPYRYNGTDFHTVGVSAVSGTASAVVVSAGTLTGQYQYAITGVNENGSEGDFAIITPTAVSATANDISITNIPEFPARSGVETKYLYRNTAGVSGIYYRVTALTAAQTSYVDNNDDSTLVTEMPLDNGTMPKCKYMAYYRGRLFAA